MNVANLLTISRIVLTPVIAILLFSDSFSGLLSAFLIFLLASLTDYLDGVVARSLETPSRLGRFLDPLADKVLVVGTFTGLGILVPHIVPWWGIALIVARDLFVTGLRSWHESRQRSLKTFFIAKVKTTVQLVFLTGIIFILAGSKSSGILRELSDRILDGIIPWAAMMFVTGFTVWTGLVYLFSRDAVLPAR